VFTARDRTQLLARAWPAATPEVRGVVVIMHGLKDYSARYQGFASRLAAGGYAVYAFDLRGHGRSAGPRVAPEHWLDYVDDLEQVLTSVEKQQPGKPVFLFGHSMGGAIAALAAEDHRPQLAGLILSGPALAIDAPPLLIAATRMSAALLPSAPALKLDNGDFSSDPANGPAMDHDPLVSQPPGPARTAGGLVDGMATIWNGVDRLTMPILALHGTKDRLTAPSGSRALIEAVPANDKTLRIYDGLFHDLLHEPNGKGKQVEDDIVAWLDAHTGGAAVTAPPIYTGELAGDPRGWTQVVLLGLGVGGSPTRTLLAGDLAFRIARPRPLGWHGALTARFAPDARSIALRPAGVATRVGWTAAGLSFGGSWLHGNELGLSTEAWIEQSLGPAHLGVAVEHVVRVTGAQPRNAGPGNSELLWLEGIVRFGGERDYWPHARAGVGPALIGGYDWVGNNRGWFVLAGLQLFGAD
jgi:alpha-beta hydrolase superfamily lysophospholipase